MTGPQTTWLSEGLEVLLAECAANPGEPSPVHFDVIIVGSGYGGAIAAAALAGATRKSAPGKPLRIAVLERGKEYLPGMFPSSMSTLAGHTRFTSPLGKKVMGNRDGLFDIRAGGDICSVMANGLGGGSLINAGVMEKPSADVFDARWPGQLQGKKQGAHELDAYYDAVAERLGAAVRTGASQQRERNTIALHAEPEQPNPPDKYGSLARIGGNDCQKAAITVAMCNGANQSQVQMNSCNFCGDCATGCNRGAKNSLDVNLLVEANRGGVRMITGATVRSIQLTKKKTWALEVMHTLPHLAAREHTPVEDTAGQSLPAAARRDKKKQLRGAELTADRVILAAGTFGSTEILLRSRERGLRLSPRLGERFSGNGDMIAVATCQKDPVNAVADEDRPAASRGIGPTITGIIDRREHREGDAPPMVIEEMAVPGPLRRVFEEVVTTAACLHAMEHADTLVHNRGIPPKDPLAVDPDAIKKSSIYAIMGDDGAGGVIGLRGDFDCNSDGGVDVTWPGLGQHPLFPAQISELQRLIDKSGAGGRVIANPLWSPLPTALDSLVDGQRGPLLTVHPLGGCAMGDDPNTGVVNDLGQVFIGDSDPTDTYKTLVVMDGAVIPCALGINPSLTIAALAARAIESLMREWQLEPAAKTVASVKTRPVYREMPDEKLPADEPEKVPSAGTTSMEFVERLRGEIFLGNRVCSERFVAEITLYFKAIELHELYAHPSSTIHDRTLTVDTSRAGPGQGSRLRLFRYKDWETTYTEGYTGRALEEFLEKHSVLTAALSGTLRVLGREPSTYCQRVRRALVAWALNRGGRDFWQQKVPRLYERPAHRLSALRSANRPKRSTCGTIRLLKNALSRAGEVRLFEYELTLGETVGGTPKLNISSGDKIIGSKRISYLRRGNPLDQLSRVTLTTFPHMVKRAGSGMLELVPQFLARSGLPLFRITKKQDGPQALADLVSLGAYFLRLLVSIHLYTLRMPDIVKPRPASRLPGNLRGLPAVEIKEIAIERDKSDPTNTPGCIRLSRYRGKTEHSQPVMMIHGYSASGTTFAHPALRVDLARHLWRRGWDVWILDMRSSCGMDTAMVNYSFEQLAATDIPVAVDHICRATGHERIDVVAHCMGAAMFSMAVLNPGSEVSGPLYQAQRNSLPGRIRRAVLSQVGPLVCMAPANIFRAYLFNYLKQWMPLENYSFSPEAGASLADEMLDRLLSAMPYPPAEFDRENPLRLCKRTPWTRIRHRLDLLYGHTFALTNLSDEVLACLDDFFGPLSVDTATQVAHFAKYQCITDASGFNRYVSRARLQSNWRFPTFSIHGRENRLADAATVQRMHTILTDAGCDYRYEVFEHFGHQDCLIGEGALRIFSKISDFLGGPAQAGKSASAVRANEMLVQPPWSGPVLGLLQQRDAGYELPVSFGCNPGLLPPSLVLVVPLQKQGDAFTPLPHGSNGPPQCRLYDAPKFDSGWGKLSLSLDGIAPNADSLLLLLLYDETPALDNAMFGDEDAEVVFTGLESVDWKSALAAARGAGKLTKNFAGKTQALAGAIAACLRSPAAHVQNGVVAVPRTGQPECLQLALGSCQYPPGIIDQVPGYRSYERLAKRLADGDAGIRPDLMLLMGDQIYADATAGVADANDPEEHFLQPYQQLYRSREVRRVLRQVPAVMVLDDHEICDNWEPMPYRDEENEEVLATGLKYYLTFQRGLHRPANKDGSLFYPFEYNGFHFFVADTRTAREPRTVANYQDKLILGEKQTEALDAWLKAHGAANNDPSDATRPKFLICPSMYAPRTRRALQCYQYCARPGPGYDGASAIVSDNWDGYPASFHHLLEKIVEYDVRNLVMLSGDAHLSCVATLVLDVKLPCWSVHASPLYAPYPFANGQVDDLMVTETITPVNAPGNCVTACAVKTEFADPGDGFAYLQVSKDNGQWQVSVRFDREAGVSKPVPLQYPLPPPSASGPSPTPPI